MKDSGYHWYRMSSSYLVDELGFKKSAACEATFIKRRTDKCGKQEEVFVALHVDDFLSTGTPKMLNDYRIALHKKFKMTGREATMHYGLDIKARPEHRHSWIGCYHVHR